MVTQTKREVPMVTVLAQRAAQDWLAQRVAKPAAAWWTRYSARNGRTMDRVYRERGLACGAEGSAERNLRVAFEKADRYDAMVAAAGLKADPALDYVPRQQRPQG